MTHVRWSELGTNPGDRDQLVALLTRRSDVLRDLGCLRYDVGVDDGHPDTVFVAETWIDPEHHAASLTLDSVRAAIAEAMPLLSGVMSSRSSEVVGSPLRD